MKETSTTALTDLSVAAKSIAELNKHKLGMFLPDLSRDIGVFALRADCLNEDCRLQVSVTARPLLAGAFNINAPHIVSKASDWQYSRFSADTTSVSLPCKGQEA
jgi:hypothetical protein